MEFTGSTPRIKRRPETKMMRPKNQRKTGTILLSASPSIPWRFEIYYGGAERSEWRVEGFIVYVNWFKDAK